MGKKSDSCACGIKSKAHGRKNKRKQSQLPPLRTNSKGYPIIRKKPTVNDEIWEMGLFDHWLEA